MGIVTPTEHKSIFVENQVVETATTNGLDFTYVVSPFDKLQLFASFLLSFLSEMRVS